MGRFGRPFCCKPGAGYCQKATLVLVGSVAILAHRQQIKPHRGSEETRPNVFAALGAGADDRAGPRRDDALDGGAIRRRSDSEEEFLGFEPEQEPAKVGRRKRKADAANLPPAEVRRSKRLREKNRSFEL